MRRWVRLCLGCLVTQSCPTLCDPVDCSIPGSSVHGILHARVLEWVAMTYPRIFPTQGPNQVSCVAGVDWGCGYLEEFSHSGCGYHDILSHPFRSVFSDFNWLSNFSVLDLTWIWNIVETGYKITYFHSIYIRLLTDIPISIARSSQ